MNSVPLLPIEVDPRPCELCGLTIDRHECIDHGEGPEFYCYPVDDLVRRWELADPRDAWRYTGETPPSDAVRNSDLNAKPETATRPYRTPQSTIDAFFYIARTEAADGIVSWLALHPRDAQHLHQLWKRKCSTAPAK